MPIHTLTPSAVTPAGAALVAVGGTLPGVLYDGDTATCGRADVAYQAHHIDLTSYTLPANEYVSYVAWRTRFNAYYPTPQPSMRWRWAVGASGTTEIGPGSNVAAVGLLGAGGGNSPEWVSPRYFSPKGAAIAGRSADDGIPWSQSDLNALAVIITPQMASPNWMYWWELTAEAGTLTMPVAHVTASNVDATRPVLTAGHTDAWTATVTNKALTSNVATLTTSAAHGFLVGNQVMVSGVGTPFDGPWTITAVTSTTFDFACTASNVGATSATGAAEVGESKQFGRVQLRVFTAAQYGAAGFDPATSDATWATDLTFTGRSADQSAQIGVDLVDGTTYRAYTRTRVKDHVYGYGALTVWTAWAYDEFTVGFTAASPAPVTATWDTATQAVTLSATGRGNLIPPSYASAEAGVAGWSVSACSVAQVADTGVHGAYATEATASGGASAVITMPYTAVAAGCVVGGERYVLRVPLKAVTETRSVTATVTWTDDAGASQGTATTAAVAPTTSDAWDLSLVLNAVAPATATRFKLDITIAGPPAASAKWRVDGLILTLAHTDAEVPSSLAYGQGGDGAGFTSFRVLLERSTDAGQTWSQVRATGTGVDQTALGLAGRRWIGSDYEAPRGATVRYRAALVAESPATFVSPGAAVSVVSGTDGQWWAKAVTAPNLNRGGVRVLTEPEFDLVEGITVHRPLGRAYPVVVSGAIGGMDGTSRILVRTAAEFSAVLTLLRHQGVLLLQTPFTDENGVGLQQWVRVVSRRWSLAGTPEEPRRLFTASWVDVGAPLVGA